jgi:hypothetical protein
MGIGDRTFHGLSLHRTSEEGNAEGQGRHGDKMAEDIGSFHDR